MEFVLGNSTTSTTMFPGNVTEPPVPTVAPYHNGVMVCDHTGEDGMYELACFRAVLSFSLGVITLLACSYKFYLFSRAHQINTTYLVVSGLAAVETLLLALKWGYLRKQLWMHFLAIFLHVVQYMFVCIFYLGLALKLLKKAKMIKLVLYPAAAVATLWFGGCFVLSTVYKSTGNSTAARNKKECREPHWIMFSSSQVVLSIVLISVSAFLTRMMSRQRMRHSSMKWVTLWLLVSAYTAEAVVQFIFDLILFTTTGDCDKTFGDWDSIGFTAFELTERISMLIPIWVMLYCWKSGPKKVTVIDTSDHGHTDAFYFTSRRNTDEDEDDDLDMEGIALMTDATE